MARFDRLFRKDKSLSVALSLLLLLSLILVVILLIVVSFISTMIRTPGITAITMIDYSNKAEDIQLCRSRLPTQPERALK